MISENKTSICNLLISRFGFEGRIWVLIELVPGHCFLIIFQTLYKAILVIRNVYQANAKVVVLVLFSMVLDFVSVFVLLRVLCAYTPNGYIVPMEFRVHFFSSHKCFFQDVQKCI